MSCPGCHMRNGIMQITVVVWWLYQGELTEERLRVAQDYQDALKQRASATTDASRKAADDLVKAAADRLQVPPVLYCTSLPEVC